MAQTIYSKITASGGMTGLGGLGITQDYNPYYAGSGVSEQSWTSEWGPTILRAIGAVIDIAANKWEARDQRSYVDEQLKAGGGTGMPKGSESDERLLALEILKRNPTWSYDKCLEIARGYNTPKSSLPSWLLPAGAAFLAYTMLRGRAK